MSLSIESIPSSPYWVPPFKPTLAGVDFLNLRQVNLDLMGVCVPGTNNNTNRVRGYSLITWVYWVYHRTLEQRNREFADRDELVHFREKVESLFVWGHQLAGVDGVPGISSKPPDAIEGKVDLRFAAWKRSRANTSLEAAVQYGPSLLDLGGLGLLHKIEHGVYACTEAGNRLGAAFDGHLRKSPAYAFLADINQLSGSPEQAKELFPFWRFDETSAAEADVFRQLLWQRDFAEEQSNRGRRASTVELILNILADADEPLLVEEIRQRFALPESWSAGGLPPGMLRQSRTWLVLQLRQLQRLAMEALMSWVERQLIRRGHCFPDKLVDLAMGAISDAKSDPVPETVEAVLAEVGSPILGIDDFAGHVAVAADRHSPWRLSHHIRQAVMNNPAEIPSLAFHSLLLLHQCRPFLEGNKMTSKHLDHGGAARVSLAHWFRLVDRFRLRSLRDLVDWTLKNLVVSQHLAVGTQRFDGQKIRLRMILEEDGLETLVRKPWQPALTPDRLPSLLSLLESCGVLYKENDHFGLM